jgi:acyl-coenzyme A thioesterase PaaI-like protein
MGKHLATGLGGQSTQHAVAPTNVIWLSLFPPKNIFTSMALQHSIDETLQYFTAIPWCKALLHRPGVENFVPPCREAKTETERRPYRTQDVLFTQTWNNATTIPHVIGFYERRETERYSYHPSMGRTNSAQRLLVGSISLVFDLQPGLTGFNGSVHGGVIMTLIDETMGSLILVNCQKCSEMMKSEPLPADVLDTTGAGYVTAELDLRFQRPLIAPTAAVVTASLDRISGRKVFINVSVTGRGGVEYAKCSGMWMAIPAEKL